MTGLLKAKALRQIIKDEAGTHVTAGFLAGLNDRLATEARRLIAAAEERRKEDERIRSLQGDDKVPRLDARHLPLEASCQIPGGDRRSAGTTPTPVEVT